MADISAGTAMDTDTWWTKGKLALVFFSMGEGDCCVITCPDGRHMMVDCGTKAFEAEGYHEVTDLLRSKDVLGATGSKTETIEALVLTHSDRDHYNRVTDLLKGLTVRNVYFSEPALLDPTRKSRYVDGPLQSYDENTANYTIYDSLKVEELCCVTTSTLANQIVLNRWTPPFRKKNHKEEVKNYVNPSDMFLTIVDDPANQFQVSIIAGNVPKEKDDKSADGINPASLVTFVKMADFKILICGDATSSTEAYLLKHHAEKLKDLTLLQVPHHGSDTSSTIEFVVHTRPKEIVVSVLKDEAVHNLPKAVVIAPYLRGDFLRTTTDTRTVGYWNSTEKKEIEKIKRTWDNEGIEYEKILEGTKLKRCLRKQPDGNGVKILDGFHKTANSEAVYIFYEIETKRKMRQTGTQGHCWFLYP